MDTTKWKRSVRNYMAFSNKKWEWIFSIMLFSLIIVFFIEFHVLRGRERFAIFTVNKCIALSSIFMIMLSMILSPIAQIFGYPRKNISLRRTFGIIGAVAMVIHIILSLFFIEKFNLEWYFNKSNYLAIIVASIATVIFSLMWYYSYKKKALGISYRNLKIIHRLGYVGIMLVVTHLLALGKLSNCIRWTENPIGLVPCSYFIFIPAFIFTVFFLVSSIKRLVK